MQSNPEIKIHENEKLVEIAAGTTTLEGILGLPDGARGVVLFVHGAGSGRLSPRNNYVARILRDNGFGTLLLDLVTVEESEDRSKPVDVDFIADRVLVATDWLEENIDSKHLPVGYFGASSGAAPALVAAARTAVAGGIPITGEQGAQAIVCRGGLADQAEPHIARVTMPTLLIVGGQDEPVIRVNEDAYKKLPGEKEIAVIPGASHLFEEPGALEEVARLATSWFKQYLRPNAD